VIYVHILEWPSDTITLPALPKRVTDASLMTGGTVSVQQTDAGIEIQVPAGSRQEIDTIVTLTLDGPAGDIPPIAISSASLASHKKATASNVYQGSAAHEPDKAFDDDPGTRWATDSGVKQAWLEVDLGKAVTFSRVSISEEYGRVRRFELQYKNGETWRTLLQGTRIGDNYSQSFAPVTAQRVRLNILEATDGPTIWEFQLMAAKKDR
jgi:alpha-L-fucosidase